MPRTIPSITATSRTIPSPSSTTSAPIPSGSIGEDSTQNNLTAIDCDASLLSDATSWSWTIVVDEDGTYTSVATFSNNTAEQTTITPDGPGVYTITCAATNDSETIYFTRRIIVTITKPVASLSVSVSQVDFSPITFNGSGSTGTGITYNHTLIKPLASSSVLSANDVASPTVIPDRIGLYSSSLTITDVYGRTSTTVATTEVGRASPSGSIGIDSTQNDLSPITCNAAPLSDAISWLWTISVDEDGTYASTATFSNNTAEQTTITPDGPGIWIVTCAASNNSGTTYFRRKIVVAIVKPIATVDPITAQYTLAQITLNSSTSTGISITQVWTLYENSREDGVVDVSSRLSSLSDVSPTFYPRRREATYIAICTITDMWGNTDVASTAIIISPRPSSVTVDTSTVAIAI